MDHPKPHLLARIKDYKPYIGPGAVNFGPYADEKKPFSGVNDNGYSDYGVSTLADSVFLNMYFFIRK